MQKTAFLSYCSCDADIANIIDSAISMSVGDKVKISRYDRDVKYKDSFKDFMNSLGNHDYVITIISDSYLKSRNCMYEAGELRKDKEYQEKILFVVLSEEDKKYYKRKPVGRIAADIYDLSDSYILYWENELRQLQKRAGRISSPTAKMLIYKTMEEVLKIVNHDIVPFLSYLADANGISFSEMLRLNFKPMLDLIFPPANSTVSYINANMGQKSSTKSGYSSGRSIANPPQKRRPSFLNALTRGQQQASPQETDSKRSIRKPIHYSTASTKNELPWDTYSDGDQERFKDQIDLNQIEFSLPKPNLVPYSTAINPQLPLLSYAYPSLDMLKFPSNNWQDTRQEDEQRAVILEETLQSFGISAQVKQVIHGPTVTRFELELASGINVKRITGLTDTIAMNLAAGGVRIEAPIPNKTLVGVEVPNREIISVTLREVLESEEMNRADSPLSVALGKDIAGTPIICDLSKMPHLLIAGATGSGKSVCINSIICSLLFRTSPKQVRMLLIDPKVVELQCYNGIPHLLTPVVSDPHKAAGALTWAVQEMMERYQRFKERNVRGISGYNAALLEGEEAMPRIVLIIDELADLMMASKREVEESICRIAQLARVVGIHLVVATQRPSVDVITGLIKNILPSRIAFAVATSIDARTIMERAGAEKLLGKGDMLYAPAGALAPMRVQGSYVSDEEVNRVTDFIRAHSTPGYESKVIELLDQTCLPSTFDSITESTANDELPDELLFQAIEMAVHEGQTSISMLQRKMRIGYVRAGRIIEEMTKRAIISPASGSKPRKVILSRDEFEAMKLDR